MTFAAIAAAQLPDRRAACAPTCRRRSTRGSGRRSSATRTSASRRPRSSPTSWRAALDTPPISLVNVAGTPEPDRARGHRRASASRRAQPSRRARVAARLRLKPPRPKRRGERAARPPHAQRARPQRDRPAADGGARGAAAVAARPRRSRLRPRSCVSARRPRGLGRRRAGSGTRRCSARASLACRGRRPSRRRRRRRRRRPRPTPRGAAAAARAAEVDDRRSKRGSSSSRRATPTARCASSRTRPTRGGGAVAKSFLDQVKLGAATTGPCKMAAFSHPRLGYGGNVGRPAVAVTSKGAVVAWTDDHEQPGHDHVYSVLIDAGGPAHVAPCATSRPRPTTRCGPSSSRSTTASSSSSGTRAGASRA